VTPSAIRRALGALALLALAPLAAPSPAGADAQPDTLVDSTWVDRWQLRNGLDVSVRHVPDGRTVAVVVAYRVGRNQDPVGRDGMADLLAELLLTAPAGDIPERSREELAELRSRGWNLQVTPRFSLISELVPTDRFPGLLRQMATRMRGVTVTDTVLARALRVTTRDLGSRYLGSTEMILVSRLRDQAAGVDDETLVRRAAGRALQKMTAEEAGERLRRLYVPANASLGIAGNLAGVDVRTLVRSLFEDIPAGTALREPPPPPLKAGGRTVTRAGLEQALGIAGVIAPALTDSLHPEFYLHALFIGRFCEQRWGAAPAPLPGRFRYPILADPDLVQFFPPVEPFEVEADELGAQLQGAVEALGSTIVDPAIFEELRVNHAWILGGAMTPPLRQRVREHPGTLHTLATTLAVRALWGSEEFWARYRGRFLDSRIAGGDRWAEHFTTPERIVRLLVTPKRP
jgi:hypothetical protein